MHVLSVCVCVCVCVLMYSKRSVYAVTKRMPEKGAGRNRFTQAPKQRL